MTGPASVPPPQLSEVTDRGLLSSAVLSPLSRSTALLTVLQPGITQHDPRLAAEPSGPSAADGSADLPDVVSSVLGVVYDIMEEDGVSVEGEETPSGSHAACTQPWFPLCHVQVSLPAYSYFSSLRPNKGSSAARVGSTGSRPPPTHHRRAGGLVPPVGPVRSQLSPDGVDEVTNVGLIKSCLGSEWS